MAKILFKIYVFILHQHTPIDVQNFAFLPKTTLSLDSIRWKKFKQKNSQNKSKLCRRTNERMNAIKTANWEKSKMKRSCREIVLTPIGCNLMTWAESSLRIWKLSSRTIALDAHFNQKSSVIYLNLVVHCKSMFFVEDSWPGPVGDSGLKHRPWYLKE